MQTCCTRLSWTPGDPMASSFRTGHRGVSKTFYMLLVIVNVAICTLRIISVVTTIHTHLIVLNLDRKRATNQKYVRHSIVTDA